MLEEKADSESSIQFDGLFPYKHHQGDLKKWKDTASLCLFANEGGSPEIIEAKMAHSFAHYLETGDMVAELSWNSCRASHFDHWIRR